MLDWRGIERSGSKKTSRLDATPMHGAGRYMAGYPLEFGEGPPAWCTFETFNARMRKTIHGHDWTSFANYFPFHEFHKIWTEVSLGRFLPELAHEATVKEELLPVADRNVIFLDEPFSIFSIDVL
jgi:hypothetical protein